MPAYYFHKFNDATQKLRRARMHIGTAREFILNYTAEGGVHFKQEHDPATGLNTLSFTPAPLNIDLLSIVGDAIHNLCSALDCATSLIVAERSGRVNRRIYFPVHEDYAQLKSSFEKGANATIAQFVPELVDQILNVFKPCGRQSPLWLVRKADNVDKHNMLIAGVASVAGFGLDFATRENVLHRNNMWILRAGEKMSLGVSKYPIQMLADPTFEANVVFGDNVPMAGADVFRFLDTAEKATFHVLAWFERTFGRIEELPTDGTVVASTAEG